ncbi:unnamed protein product [Strongylus vulgaris]|uniref:C-type lectin domain-containing protein n=1 Tax=Strongylus vulgaris TaxID=40348 RepID=A0A3P7IX73_STRVU|nr:unnamed protein product [Strongylus vulgaris]
MLLILANVLSFVTAGQIVDSKEQEIKANVPVVIEIARPKIKYEYETSKDIDVQPIIYDSGTRTNRYNIETRTIDLPTEVKYEYKTNVVEEPIKIKYRTKPIKVMYETETDDSELAVEEDDSEWNSDSHKRRISHEHHKHRSTSSNHEKMRSKPKRVSVDQSEGIERPAGEIHRRHFKSSKSRSSSGSSNSDKKVRPTSVSIGIKFNVWLKYAGKKYMVRRNAKNFDDAEQSCKGHGGHLASIHTEAENNFIHSTFYS